jgi:hypothetical protein
MGSAHQQVGALGEPEPQQPLGVLVGAALPGPVRVAEEEFGLQRDLDAGVQDRVSSAWICVQ